MGRAASHRPYDLGLGQCGYRHLWAVGRGGLSAGPRVMGRFMARVEKGAFLVLQAGLVDPPNPQTPREPPPDPPPTTQPPQSKENTRKTQK